MPKNVTPFYALTLCALGLAVALQAPAQTHYTPVALTGFSEDIVADGSGTAQSSTTNDMDGGNVNTRFCFVSPTFVNPAGDTPLSSLPATGLITSANTTGLSFQLAAYTVKNSMRITASGSGTLTFATPQAATDVYLLAASGNGASTFDATVTFADLTTQVFPNLTADDWFGGLNYAIMGVSRVNYDNDVIEQSTIDPRLYELRLTLAAANRTKPIRSVLFEKTTATATLNVMGISINATPLAVAADVADAPATAFPNPVTDRLTVQLPATARAAAARLADLTGRVLQTVTPAEGQASFNFATLPAGLYLVQYQGRAGTRTLRVEKQ